MTSLTRMRYAVQRAIRGLAWPAATGALAAVAAGGLVPTAAAQAATPAYTITDLGHLGYPSSSPAGVNTAGQVAGDSYLQATIPGPCPPKHPCKEHLERAFSYSGGIMTSLGTLGGNFSYGQAINTAGQVAGYSTLPGLATTHAFLGSGGAMTDLGTIAGTGSSEAFAVNDSGQVAGWSTTAADAQHAFLFSNGKMTDLGAYNIDTVAEAINISGVIVGTTYGADSAGNTFNHAFIYTGGQFRDLNTLIPAGSSFELTAATGINSAGQIIASGYNTTNGQLHAFLLSPPSRRPGAAADTGGRTRPTPVQPSGDITPAGLP
ncbi:MAG TPA: hypothetical protein VGA04_17545 [Streptosporangiaceae bacterium]